MKKIIVISDNHAQSETQRNIIENSQYDVAIHLGDSEQTERTISELFDYYVSGNRDDAFVLTNDTFEIEGLKFAITHGDRLGALTEKQYLQFANKYDADVVLHGHIHYPLDRNFGNKPVRVLCPGSIALPRNGSRKSYLEIVIDNGAIITANIINV